MDTQLLIPILTLGVLGLLFGLGLAAASRKFHVDVDPKLERINTLLPGANCGACGQAGCFGFAESLLGKDGDVNKCRVCGETNKEQIAKLLGKKLEKKAKFTARLRCNGGKKVKDKFIYTQIQDCVAANLVMKGQKECLYGCLGFGTCERVCPFDAIHMSSEGLPVVDDEKCKACNKCVLACPKKLFTLVPVNSPVYVACSSHDMGKDVKAVCPVGCISCKLCEKACAFDAIHVIDNLARIDFTKCTSCGKCVTACPMKTILIKGKTIEVAVGV
ncbi:MAG: RnfABCDGE type electron transport complex subunit B [Candidatus Omnitrophota bacterium]|jgi:RnfABCDGE-type electron transport complex B subunit